MLAKEKSQVCWEEVLRWSKVHKHVRSPVACLRVKVEHGARREFERTQGRTVIGRVYENQGSTGRCGDCC